MLKYDVFNKHAAEYDAWFEKYPFVFQTELAAIKKLWPAQENIRSLEVGCATGRFASELHISEGIDPSGALCSMAEERGVFTLQGIAENLPYQGSQFDVVLMNFCISYLESPRAALKEVLRVLKPGGAIIVGFIKKGSLVGDYYEEKKAKSLFYKDADFFYVQDVEDLVRNAGFVNLQTWQTLFHLLDEVVEAEDCIPGSDRGSYIFIKAFRKAL